MALNYFAPTVLAGYINSFPNSPIRFEDLNADNILCAFPTSWVNPETGVNTSVIQVEVCEGGSTVIDLIRTIYVFPLNDTITDLDAFLAFVDYYAPNNALEKYTELYAIDNIENVLKKVNGVYRPILFNNNKIIRKNYIPSQDKTVIQTNAGNEYKAKLFWVEGDQGNAVEAYELYG
jgi:hypothetical protein